MPVDLYYFISSLPALRWGEKPPLGYDAFLAACQEHLGPKLTAHLKAISLIPNGQPASPTIAAWEEWETSLRNAIAELRAAKLRKNASAWLRDGEDLYSGDRKRLEDAMNQPTARDRERAIDHLRWRQLEQLAFMRQFDVATLELYTLGLLLSEKYARHNFDAGNETYQQLVEQGFDQAKEQQESTSA